MLLAGIFAGAHVALEHGGDSGASHFDADSHVGYHDDDEGGPAPTEGHHHHDLGAVPSAQFEKSVAKRLFAPRWTLLYGRLVARVAAMPRETGVVQERSLIGDSPPDERAFGCLLDCHTAHPVRGPSAA